MNRLLFSRYLLVILTLSHASLSWSQLAIAPANPVATEAGPLAHVTVKLPIRLYWGYLVVIEASIGNIRKLNFLVDTGAYPSVIDQKIARRLGLAEQPARVNLSKNSVETRLVVLPSLLLGPIRADSLRVLSEDLSFIQKTVGHKVDGIVGLDVLRKSSFTIDYRTKEMLASRGLSSGRSHLILNTAGSPGNDQRSFRRFLLPFTTMCNLDPRVLADAQCQRLLGFSFRWQEY